MQTARALALAEAADEYRRLLYVAMTRAAEWLIVCGAKGQNAIPKGCWYELVTDALKDLSVIEPADDGGGEVWRFRKGAAPAAAAGIPEEPPAQKTIALPDWLSTDAPREKPALRTVTPSGFEDATARPASGGDGLALLRGSLVHRLMQALPDIPAERRLQASQDYIARAGKDLPAEERSRIAGQVIRIIENERFGALYGPMSRAEVPIVGKVERAGEPVLVSGRIDRLAITEISVLIADFKTDRRPPESLEKVPPGYVGQLALYRAVLEKLYPGKAVRAALVWTESVEFMEVSQAMLDDALMQVTSAR